jgi:hypothetical protein
LVLSPRAALVVLGGSVLLGLLLVGLFLRRWVRSFYAISTRAAVALFVGLCALGVAFFGGLPVAPLPLGLLAGIYTGRRARYLRPDVPSAQSMIHRSSLLAATVTTASVLSVGLEALANPSILERALVVVGLDQRVLTGLPGLALVMLVCLLLFGLQYSGTRAAGHAAFFRDPRRRRRTPR